MVIGIGTDIVSNERIAALYARQGERFAQRILTNKEITLMQQRSHPERFLAKRWAIKESVSKALGTGFAQGVSFQDMEISNNDLGAPVLHLSGKSLEVAQSKQINDWQISVSDEVTHSVAFVIAQRLL